MTLSQTALTLFLSTPSARRATKYPFVFDPLFVISIHALREEGDAQRDLRNYIRRVFLSTPSARRATEKCREYEQHDEISIHALREEGDPLASSSPALPFAFLSTPSARRATRDANEFMTAVSVFLSTPSARRATPLDKAGDVLGDISIHALREEGDLPHWLSRPTPSGISIHALREEGDQITFADLTGITLFLSTPSARRATRLPAKQNPPPSISIHALREEGDRCFFVFAQSFIISIHALREEGDSDVIKGLLAMSDFYPRPPRGGRRASSKSWRIVRNFYPRPPRGGRRTGTPQWPCCPCISIHALREEGDMNSNAGGKYSVRFLSTPSARRATGGLRCGPDRH